MNWLTLLFVAVGLAMDAFAVSVSAGIVMHEVKLRHTFRIATYFGAFQGAMPMVGWLAGRSLHAWVAPVAPWVAFGLLMLIGLRMIFECLGGAEGAHKIESLGVGRLLVLAIATSIDALAVGITIALLGFNIWKAALVIGIVTGTLSALGVEMGDHLMGERFGEKAEFAGGVILCAIGVRILLAELL
jgi:putative Mn2+ efflux pump MntP